MPAVPPDPLEPGGIAQFAQDFRAARITSLAVVQAYLARIDALDPALGAFQQVDHDGALATAQAIDALRAAGTDLGPLMGVPVAVKDVFAIDGLPPPTAGSLIDSSALVGKAQAPFITALRQCGAVILGTTRAVELCFGITGVSTPLGTPRNPWDASTRRLPGGSSSGSGVACGAGLCALAIGTDTGGSVRVPAAFNGVFGLKTTFGRWPTQGTVPLNPDLDTIGLLTKSAHDAQLAFDAINARLPGHAAAGQQALAHLAGLRVGVPSNYYYEDLSAEVSTAINAANARLIDAGACLEPIEISEASEREAYFPIALPVSVLAVFGSATMSAAAAQMDPTIAARVASGREVRAGDYLAAEYRRRRSQRNGLRYFQQVEILAAPTAAEVPPPLAALDEPREAMRLALGMTRCTQPGNYLGQCAVSLPLPRTRGQLPVGYQLIGAPGTDARLLAIACAVEAVLGKPTRPDLSGFLAS